VQPAWRTVEDTKAAEIYGLNAGLARRLLAGDRANSAKAWEKPDEDEKGRGSKGGEKVCALAGEGL
jgi:hypothetical protein